MTMTITETREMFRTLTVEERVDNGMRWLTENFPDWKERVDPNSLRLWSGEKCICGQVFSGEVSDDIDTGFEYAQRNLFSEANSWINGIVGMETKSEFDEERALRVAAALGFNVYFIIEYQSGKSFHTQAEGEPSIDALEQEWKRRLGQS